VERAPVIRSSGAAEAVLSGGQSTHARCDPSLSDGNRQSYDTIPQPGKVRPDRLTAIHFRCQTLSGHVQGRNALGGNTGSELVPAGLAGPDRRSRSRWIGHTPYIAHHRVEPLVDVSELRSQSLGTVGTDDQPGPVCIPVKRLARLPAPARRRVVNGFWPDPCWTFLRPRLRLHLSPDNRKPFGP
jgi:hypothetical protein